ncbi:MAG: IPT/TIG domain-containing protein, partial [Deltaproteobacteria bacterium]|nr:IPT/TIG domain-containing protein [Deltaproteobacteria bacterium]
KAPFILAVEPASGPAAGGNQVRLRCSHLQGQPEVYFGGRPAEVKSHKIEGAAHELVVIAPSGPAGMGVEVVVVGDQQAVREQGYRYGTRKSDLPPARPQVTVSAANGMEVCEQYFDAVESCMAGQASGPSLKKAIDQAREQIRKMAKNASRKEIEAMAESCRQAMDSIAKTFKNCSP